MIKNLLLVGSGGFLGAVFRYLFTTGISRCTEGFFLPFGTLFVNILGCFLLGFGFGLAEIKQLNLLSFEGRYFFFTGFLGSYTTYSTFGLESFYLAKTGQLLWAVVNIFLHLVIGLSAVWLGDALARSV